MQKLQGFREKFTDEENAINDHLGEAWALFMDLDDVQWPAREPPIKRSWEHAKDDFWDAIRAAQNLLLSRVAMRILLDSKTD